MTTRILVTGGAGFIGSHYVRALLEGPPEGSPGRSPSGHGPDGAPEVPPGPVELTVLDALTYAGDPANLDPVRDDPRFTFVHGDIRDSTLVDRLLTVRRHDQIVHFAAETHVDRSIAGAAGFVTTNVVGTQVLLDAALRHGVDVFVHISTDEVYGSIPLGSWPETDPLHPNSPYSAAKASSDLLALAYHRTHGLDVRVTRCSNNYGPRQFPEKVVPLFVTNLLDGRHVPLYGDGRQVRDWLHVSDHVRGVELVRRGGRPGEVYNIGGGTELTNRELTGLLLDACGAGWDMVDQVADRKGHDLRYSLDWAKIRAELGYVPAVDFATGLAGTVAWYRDNRARWEPRKAQAGLVSPR